MLVALDGLHEAISIEVGGQKHPVRGKREGVDPGRTTAVHYLKVTLPADTVAAWCSSDQEAFFVIDHEAYRQRVAIDGEVAKQLRADLQ